MAKRSAYQHKYYLEHLEHWQELNAKRRKGKDVAKIPELGYNKTIEGVRARSAKTPAGYAKLAEKGVTTPHYNQIENTSAGAALFTKKITAAKKASKFGGAVDVLEPKDYKSSKMYLSDDGMSGFAIKKDGDLVSVFKHPKAVGNLIGRAVAVQAASEGSDRLDCYSVPGRGNLVKMYSVAGFKEAAKVKINPDFDNTGGKADYVSVMARTTKKITVKSFGDTEDDYNNAMKYRDSLLDGGSK